MPTKTANQLAFFVLVPNPFEPQVFLLFNCLRFICAHTRILFYDTAIDIRQRAQKP